MLDFTGLPSRYIRSETPISRAASRELVNVVSSGDEVKYLFVKRTATIKLFLSAGLYVYCIHRLCPEKGSTTPALSGCGQRGSTVDVMNGTRPGLMLSYQYLTGDNAGTRCAANS
jgi:hypothetical protein